MARRLKSVGFMINGELNVCFAADLRFEAVAKSEFEGIPILHHGQTTRYFGYQVGTGDLGDVN